MRTLSLFSWIAGALAVGLLGCGSSTPSAESPESSDTVEQASEEPAGGAEPGAVEAEAEVKDPAAAPGSAKPTADNTIPDDYAMMSGDCVQLGKQLAAATRADQLALLSPKLTEAQKAQADKNITDVANRLGEKWTEGCEGSLVGKVVDRKSLKCALDAKSVKVFDACLNASPAGEGAAQ